MEIANKYKILISLNKLLIEVILKVSKVDHIKANFGDSFGNAI